MRRSRLGVEWLALWIAATLFLWMFLASDGLARTVAVERGGGLDPETRQRAAEFADRWRHGLVGWPLFVPGFLLTAVAVAVCERCRSFRALAAMGATAIVVGFATAWPLAPFGTEYVASVLEAKTGIEVAEPFAHGGVGVLAAMATFVAFGLLVIICRRCARNRRWKPLMIPAAAYVGLAALRGGGVQFGELSSTWANRLWSGDLVAIVSSVVAIGLTVGLLWDAAARSPDN